MKPSPSDLEREADALLDSVPPDKMYPHLKHSRLLRIAAHELPVGDVDYAQTDVPKEYRQATMRFRERDAQRRCRKRRAAVNTLQRAV